MIDKNQYIFVSTLFDVRRSRKIQSSMVCCSNDEPTKIGPIFQMSEPIKKICQLFGLRHISGRQKLKSVDQRMNKLYYSLLQFLKFVIKEG